MRCYPSSLAALASVQSMSIQMIASADTHTIRKANEDMHDIGVIPMRSAGLAGIVFLCSGAAQLAESEPRVLPMPTGRKKKTLLPRMRKSTWARTRIWKSSR